MTLEIEDKTGKRWDVEFQKHTNGFVLEIAHENGKHSRYEVNKFPCLEMYFPRIEQLQGPTMVSVMRVHQKRRGIGTGLFELAQAELSEMGAAHFVHFYPHVNPQWIEHIVRGYDYSIMGVNQPVPMFEKSETWAYRDYSVNPVSPQEIAASPLQSHQLPDEACPSEPR